MNTPHSLDLIAINVRAHKLLKLLMQENPTLKKIMVESNNETEALESVKNWVLPKLKQNDFAYQYYLGKESNYETFQKITWQDYASIRILDYVDHAGREYEDLNLRGQMAVSNPIKMIWLAVNFGKGGARPGFFEDMLHLFRQFKGAEKRDIPSPQEVTEWKNRFLSGLDERVIKLREKNRDRIIDVLIKKIDNKEIKTSKYLFEVKDGQLQKREKMLRWWDEGNFHLRFAIRSPELLNEMMDYSLDPDTMKILRKARKAGIPFFINPYYLSLLHVTIPSFAAGADLAIRNYIIYTKQLVGEFGNIVAWEKEDKIEPGKPNAAGWLLPPYNNIHRRYPEVAILIPDTMGRACGGLCASCQRMYDFQRGNLNFNLDKLKPQGSWDEKLQELMAYFENDTQLRDILITGGDGLMTSDKNLEKILNSIYGMAFRKKEANKTRADGKKFAEITRVRIGTRLPVYLPQRITESLAEILKQFKIKASKIGIKQFIIQTHFISPMEITPEAKIGVTRLLKAGWGVTNQMVFTTAASRRGHSAKLRETLNEIGILPYYTFTVKGYMENNFNFVPNARSVQEQQEEKILGNIPGNLHKKVEGLTNNPEKITEQINGIRKEIGQNFLSFDRNVLNLPGVGKSMTFRVIGITRYGRRILEFDHDINRNHSPIIEKMGKVIIIESKSISEYLTQLEEMGEDISVYNGVYGYSMGQTEPRLSLFEYPEYDYQVTKELTNLEII